MNTEKLSLGFGDSDLYSVQHRFRTGIFLDFFGIPQSLEEMLEFIYPDYL
jgi:hypothetical protein